MFIVGTLSTVLIAVLVVRAMLPKFFNWFRKTAFPIPKVLASTVSLALLAVFVISKEFPPGSFYSLLQSPYVSLYSPSSSATLNAITNALSPAQYRARFALTSATNVMHDFTAPTNAVFCDLGSGVHDEAYWIPVSFNPEGTATNSRWGRAVCAAPSGMVLLDDVPDRLAPSLPDFSAQSRTASSPFSKRLRACCLPWESSGIPLRPTAPSSSPGTTYSSDATRTPSPTSSSSFSKAETSSTASASTRTPTPPS